MSIKPKSKPILFRTHQKLVNKSFNCSLFLMFVVTFKHFLHQIPIETIRHENYFSFLRQLMSGDCWGIVQDLYSNFFIA